MWIYIYTHIHSYICIYIIICIYIQLTILLSVSLNLYLLVFLLSHAHITHMNIADHRDMSDGSGIQTRHTPIKREREREIERWPVNSCPIWGLNNWSLVLGCLGVYHRTAIISNPNDWSLNFFRLLKCNRASTSILHPETFDDIPCRSKPK